MPVTINGTTGIAGVDGSAGNPSYQGGDTNTGMFFPAADTIAFAEGGAEVMRIDSAGNVGIGVTPSAWQSAFVAAQVGSSAALWSQKSGFGSTYLSSNLYYDGARKFLNTGRTAEYEQFDGMHLFKYSASGSAGATVSQSEAMRIDTSGNLLVGTTSSYNGFINSRTADGRWGLVIRDTFGNTAGVQFQNSSGTAVGSITIQSSSTNYNTSSDYRLKHDIQPMTGALAKVALLKPVTYKWNADNSDGEGFIAHELQEVCPSAVIGEKDAVDAEGNIVPQGIDTSFLVATLTAAIQEQQALIESLTARIAALEAK